MATYAQFKHVELYKIGHGKNRVPNAPKSCIAEIFSSDATDNAPRMNGSTRPRVVRDTPTRPRDTHARLFGQAVSQQVAPMVTDTIRSHIKFEDPSRAVNGDSPAHSPKMNGTPTKMTNGSPKLTNGSASSTPSRGERGSAEHSSYGLPRRNPVTGDGVPLPTRRRPHPAIGLRGADLSPDEDEPHILAPQPTHRYYTTDWPPKPANYYVTSTTKPALNIKKNPYTLLGLQSDDPDIVHPIIDENSISPQPILDRHWPPFPAQHYLEPKEKKTPYHPLPSHAFIGMTSALGERPQPDYKYNPVPTLDGPIDPYLVANTNPPPTLFKYERDGPIPDVTPIQTEQTPGPRTLTGFPPIFHKHVPGYLFDRNRHAEDLKPKTYYLDYCRQRHMEGNPITGDGYKTMNGQINTVTSINGSSHIFHHTRVPPGGFSSGLW